MSDLPPPLPETADPFTLLGIEPSASVREIRAAYARQIKRYRPDRHPEQFQRIHAAYEAVVDESRQQGESAPVHAWEPVEYSYAHAPAPGELGDGEPKPAAVELVSDPVELIARRLTIALAAGERSAVDAALTAVTGRILLGTLLDALDLDARLRVLTSEALTWPRIRASSGRQASLMLRFALEVRLRARDSGGVIALLDDPIWWADAETDPSLVEIGWWALGTAAWLESVDHLVPRLMALPWESARAGILDRAENDLAAAELMRETRSGLPSEMIELMIVERTGPATAVHEVARDLKMQLERDSDSLLRRFDFNYLGVPAIAGRLEARFSDGMPAARDDIHAMDHERTQAIVDAIAEWDLARSWLLGILATCAAAGAVLATLVTARPVFLGVGVGVVLPLLIVMLSGSHARVRRHLARVATRFGVTRRCLGQCVARLAPLQMAITMALHARTMIERDHALRGLALAAAWAANLVDESQRIAASEDEA